MSLRWYAFLCGFGSDVLFKINHFRSISFFCQNAHHDWLTKEYISNWFLVLRGWTWREGEEGRGLFRECHPSPNEQSLLELQLWTQEEDCWGEWWLCYRLKGGSWREGEEGRGLPRELHPSPNEQSLLELQLWNQEEDRWGEWWLCYKLRGWELEGGRRGRGLPRELHPSPNEQSLLEFQLWTQEEDRWGEW